MGRVERDQLLPKDGAPKLPSAPDSFTPGVKGGNWGQAELWRKAPGAATKFADPNIQTRMMAMEDMGRSTAHAMPPGMVPPGETASGGSQAPPGAPAGIQSRGDFLQANPRGAGQAVPDLATFATEHFPSIASSKYITPAELQMVQSAYQMAVSRAGAASEISGQQFDQDTKRYDQYLDARALQGKQGGGPGPVPTNLPGMMGHAALNPEQYTPEKMKALTDAAELVYGKGGGSSKGGAKSRSRKTGGAGGKSADKAGTNGEALFPGLKATEQGPGKGMEAFRKAADGQDGIPGFLGNFEREPVKTWFELRAYSRSVAAEVQPKLALTLERFLDRMKPPADFIIKAEAEGTITREQANELLSLVLTEQEKQAMGVGNERGGAPQGSGPQGTTTLGHTFGGP